MSPVRLTEKDVPNSLKFLLRADIKNVLPTPNFFLLLFNGSQSKKTFSEKELSYAKVVIRVKAVEHLCNVNASTWMIMAVIQFIENTLLTTG